nr:hypothetical protein [Mycobacterium sp. UM_NZ2]
MKLPLSAAHTFVLRVWLEEIDTSGRARWVGHVTHILDERRQYVNSLQGVGDFIRSYLRTTGDRDGSVVESFEEPPK